MRLSDTTAARLSRGTAALLAAALCWVASGTTSYSQSSADTGVRGRSVGPTVNLPGFTTLSGHVEDEAGKPVAQAVVALGSDSVLTSADGEFVLHASPGAYLLTIRRLGFRVERFAVSLAAGEPRDVTVVVARFVPVLPTVTTTAKERAAYLSVGFEQRMRAGIGQFLTYEQIVHKQAPYFTDLLREMRGIQVKSPPGSPGAEDYLVGTRGPGSCVTYVIDGTPQQQIFIPPPSLDGGPGVIPGGPESPNHWVQPNDVGAVEVYGPSERPSGFGTDQSCNLVMIWTRAKLGLTGNSTALSASSAPGGAAAGHASAVPDITRGLAVISNDASCKPPTPADTVDLIVYATVEGTRPETISDSAWSRYKAGVLDVLDRSAALPSDLVLPAFGVPFQSPGEVKGDGHREVRVAPVLSNVIAFTLDASGALREAHVAASSMSGGADTTVLAIVEQASATHSFPRLPAVSGELDSGQLLLVVASLEPKVGTRAALIGELEVPTWDLTRPARLAGSDQSREPDGTGNQPSERAITIEAVISDAGRVIPSTLRVIGALAGASHVNLLNRARALQFEPALIGSCPVPELLLQPL